jgi:hypothetical protein
MTYDELDESWKEHMKIIIYFKKAIEIVDVGKFLINIMF